MPILDPTGSSQETRYIVLLKHLFLRPVPAEFGRRKTERLQTLQEATLPLGKGFGDGKMCTKLRRAREPDRCGRSWLRGMGGKYPPRPFPVCLW
jgi:hypothetical protein